jgi:hypothetical protein
MLALIVKPRLRGTNKFEKVLDDLSSFSPVILEGDNLDSLKGEIEQLRDTIRISPLWRAVVMALFISR